MYAKKKSFMKDRGMKTRSQKTLELKKKLDDLQKSIIDYRAAYEQKSKQVRSLEKENELLEIKNNKLLTELMKAEYQVYSLNQPPKFETF